MKSTNLLLISVLLGSSIHGLDILRSHYPWPHEKPDVAPEIEDTCLNGAHIKPFLHANVKLIVELGSWLGCSARFFLNNAPQAAVIAVDHWKGSLEHQQFPFWAQKLPTLYETFLVNCWQYQDRLIPLRADTLNGLQMIYDAGLRPDIVYVDAMHEYASVMGELEKIHDLFPHARILGDDWSWYMVRMAVIQFCMDHGFTYRFDNNFWYIQK